MLLFFVMPKSELDQNFSTTNVAILRHFPKDAIIKSKAMGFIPRQNDENPTLSNCGLLYDQTPAKVVTSLLAWSCSPCQMLISKWYCAEQRW